MMILGSGTLNSHQFIIDPEDWYIHAKKGYNKWNLSVGRNYKITCVFFLLCYSNLPFMLCKIYRNNTTIKKSMTFQALRYVPMCCRLCSSSSSVCSSFWSDLGFTMSAGNMSLPRLCYECWPEVLNKISAKLYYQLPSHPPGQGMYKDGIKIKKTRSAFSWDTPPPLWDNRWTPMVV